MLYVARTFCLLYCNVLWSGSQTVVSLCEAIYCSVSCVRLEERALESLLVLYNCLLQIIIAELRRFERGDWVTYNESCQRWGSWDDSISILVLN